MQIQKLKKIKDMVQNPTIKINKERNRTLVLAVEVQIYSSSRAQRLLICFKTSEETTLNLTGQTNQINKSQIL